MLRRPVSAALALLPFLLQALGAPPPASAADLPCLPCAGVRVESPLSLLDAVRGGPELAPEAELPVAWEEELGGAASPALARAVAASGLAPWVTLVFRAPAPLLDHLPALQRELAVPAALVRGGRGSARFQI
ncbi:MAG TPA: hypothetical protein VLA75_07630, partial [Thermoanaerobaculia bacterium]|nr:hypothetical protein [Thermoanaerobaculia bacterium]